MTDSTNLGLPYIAAGQAQKHITHNMALRALDALVQLSVLDRDLTAPPGGPDEGDRHIVATGATAAWSGRDGDVAAWQDGAWSFLAPREGWLAWVEAEELACVFAGGDWAELVNPVPFVGVNATADVTNRLAVAADATLFSHDGDNHQVKINKAAAGDTASLLLQDSYSGRAEIGLAGDDNLSFKVSSDGSTWRTGLMVDASNGRVSFPSGGAREMLSADRTYYVRADGSDGNTGLANSAGGAFLTIQKAIDVVALLDIGPFNVTIQVGNGTFTGGVAVMSPWLGSGTVTLCGENSTGTVISTTSADAIKVDHGGRLIVAKLKVQTTTGGACLYAVRGGAIGIGASMEFGATATYHSFADLDGRIVLDSQTYTISGGGLAHMVAQFGSVRALSVVVTATGSPAFVNGFAFATGMGLLLSASASYSGTVTGPRYLANLNGIIRVFGGGASYFPGNSAGSTATGGQYA